MVEAQGVTCKGGTHRRCCCYLRPPPHNHFAATSAFRLMFALVLILALLGLDGPPSLGLSDRGGSRNRQLDAGASTWACHAFTVGGGVSSRISRHNAEDAPVWNFYEASTPTGKPSLALPRHHARRRNHVEDDDAQNDDHVGPPDGDEGGLPKSENETNIVVSESTSPVLVSGEKGSDQAPVGRKRKLALRALGSTLRFAFRTAKSAARYGAKKMVHLYDIAEDALLVEGGGGEGGGPENSVNATAPAGLEGGVVPASANVVGMSTVAQDTVGRYRQAEANDLDKNQENTTAIADEINTELKLDPDEVADREEGEDAPAQPDIIEAVKPSNDIVESDNTTSGGASKIAETKSDPNNNDEDKGSDNGTVQEPIVSIGGGEEGSSDHKELEAAESSDTDKSERRPSVFSRLRSFGRRRAKYTVNSNQTKVNEDVDSVVVGEKDIIKDEDSPTAASKSDAEMEPVSATTEIVDEILVKPDINATTEVEAGVEDNGNQEENPVLEGGLVSGNSTNFVSETNDAAVPANETNTMEEEGLAVAVETKNRTRITKILMGAKKRSKLIAFAIVAVTTLPYLEVVENEAGGITGVAVAGLPRGDELWDGVREVAARGAAGGKRGLVNAISAAGRAREAWDARNSAPEVDEADLPTTSSTTPSDDTETFVDSNNPSVVILDDTESGASIQDNSIDRADVVDMIQSDHVEVEVGGSDKPEVMAEEGDDGAEEKDGVRAEASAKEDNLAAEDRSTADEHKNDDEGLQENEDSKRRSKQNNGWAAEEALKNALATRPIVGGSTAVMEAPVIETQTQHVNAMSSVSSAVQKIGPATVRVDTETEIERAVHVGPRVDGQNDGNEAEGEDGEVFGGVPSPMKPQRWQYVQQGQGSGIIISEDGLICTNAHVIEGATRVYVTLTDGRRFPAEVKGTDEIVDIAVLKIIRNDGGTTTAAKGKKAASQKDEFNGKLPVAELADSDSLEVGNFVVAIGSPGGLDNTVTMGIVSGLKRSSEEVGLYDKKVEFIQTDAAINMGNSGGPLVDVLSGKVIGINTCMRYNMEGTSFAVPTNKVKSIMHDLAEGKQISHGYVGIYTATLTPEFAREKNADPNSNYGVIPEANGVIVLHIYEDTPASAAGLRRADVITQIGKKKVSKAAEAYKLIDSAEVGTPIDFKIIRGDKSMTIKVKPDEFARRLRMAKEQREKKRKEKMHKLKEESLQDNAGAVPPLLQDKEH